MSGIAGIFYPEGRPVERNTLRRMVDRMAHRGPDGIHVWHEGCIGLGHCMLHATPESLHEQLPFRSDRSGCVITADARIDNRDELFSALRLRRTVGRIIPDSTLILRAYEKWGADCVDHLVGDFTFAIWDQRNHTLFLARDHFGIRQLYYHHAPGRHLAFATEIKALLALPFVPEAVNEKVLADHLTLELLDHERTIFEGIHRVLPAHTVRVSRDGCRNARYWEPEASEQITGWEDEQYAERFLELFKEAVRCRLRSAGPVGAELSGGLDSSFVTCVAHEILEEDKEGPLHTFSTVYDTLEECDERDYIRAITPRKGIKPHYCSVEEQGTMSLLDEIFEYLDDGRVSGNHYLNWITAREAGRSGVQVLLTGQDGDTTVAHGFEYFHELARSRRWERFAREAKQLARHLQEEGRAYARQEEVYHSPENILDTYAAPHLIKWAEHGAYWKFLRSLFVLQDHFAVTPSRVIRRYWRKLLTPQAILTRRRERSDTTQAPPIVDPQFAERTRLAERLADKKQEEREWLGSITVRGEQQRTLRSAFVTYSMEIIDTYGAASGVEMRHPFMDKRLIEYCLALPPEQSLSGGWPRTIMRRAMEGIVPPCIQWRIGKTDLSAQHRHLLLDLSASVLDRLISEMEHLEPYIDLQHLDQLFEKREAMSSREVLLFGRIMSLSYWFNKRYGAVSAGTGTLS